MIKLFNNTITTTILHYEYKLPYYKSFKVIRKDQFLESNLYFQITSINKKI